MLQVWQRPVSNELGYKTTFALRTCHLCFATAQGFPAVQWLGIPLFPCAVAATAQGFPAVKWLGIPLFPCAVAATAQGFPAVKWLGIPLFLCAATCKAVELIEQDERET